MGPITLFDKSFLQSLSVDESVWLDNFFLNVISPLFYVETLADLEKTTRGGRTPEEEVGLIADKFPEMHGAPCTFHVKLCTDDLLGNAVPMDGRIPLAGGRPVKVEGRSGIVYEQSPELEAFSRWHNHEFLEIERLYAQAWRRALAALDLGQGATVFRVLGVDGKFCRSLEDAKASANTVISARERAIECMALDCVLFNIPRDLQFQIVQRWCAANRPALVEYAPYASYVLTVEVFFQIALAANLISDQRPSNRVDIAYLFYLPFCMMFASCDRLHRRCAPLFLRKDQEFIWGQELKEALGRLNTYYLRLPDTVKERGVMSFATEPSKAADSFVATLWDRFLPSQGKVKAKASTKTSARILEEINKMKDAPSLSWEEPGFDPTNPNCVLIKRSVRRVKGSWYQVPKRI